MKLATICTGGGIYEQGAIASGLEPIWGVEINPRVAEVYKLNYPDSQMVVSDVCQVDWNTLPMPDVLHASPSCRHFSTANNKTEAAKDIGVAQAVGRAINHFLPQIFTLENVAAYQNSESWAIINRTLEFLGYSVSYQVHKLKYWGIPQKQRNRFIAIAIKSNELRVTSNKYCDPTLLFTRYSLLKGNLLLTPNRTRHWYEEIRDLIPTFEPSFLTNTQKDKLNHRTRSAIAEGEIVLLKRNQIRDYTPTAYESDPYCWSITATLCTDQREGDRSKFADLVTSDGIFSLNTRALARIQTIPDSYKLLCEAVPFRAGNIAIDGLVIGDGVPCYFVQQMWEQILKSNELQVTSNACLLDVNRYPCELEFADVAPQRRGSPEPVNQKEVRSTSEKVSNFVDTFKVTELQQLEQIIEKESQGLVSFDQVGTALVKIKNDRLFKPEYKSFIVYCWKKFNLSKARVYQLINASKIYQEVSTKLDGNLSELQISEAHCRSLAKIKDVEMRSQVLEQVAKKGTITAKAIESEYRSMRLEEINERLRPDLPDAGEVVRLTSKSDLLSMAAAFGSESSHPKRAADFNGYWGIVTAKNEFTCDVRVLGVEITTMHPQDFMHLKDADSSSAIALLDRLDKIISFACANDTVQLLCKAIATRPYPLLEEMDDLLLSTVEQAETVYQLEQAWKNKTA